MSLLSPRPVTDRRVDSGLPVAAEEVLRGMRDVRFAAGGHCPRCGHPAPIRWGLFSGRQRYRCRSCRRTFSDLTGTALAYTKRLPCWRDYFVRFREGQPLRRVATGVGIHVSTAFRWRHRILRACLAADGCNLLAGSVELHELLFAVSSKGTRQPPGYARRRGARFTALWATTPHCRVVVARDRHGRADAFQLELTVTSPRELAAVFSTRIEHGSTLLLGRCFPTDYAIAARRCGMHFFAVFGLGQLEDDPRRHVRNVAALARRLLTWLNRFRGVATHYLANYCAWHRMVDRDSEASWLHFCYGHVSEGPRGPP